VIGCGDEVDELLGRHQPEDGGVDVARGHDGFRELATAVITRQYENDEREGAELGLSLPAASERLVLLTFPEQHGDALCAAVDLDEPMVFVVDGGGDGIEVGAPLLLTNLRQEVGSSSTVMSSKMPLRAASVRAMFALATASVCLRNVTDGSS
jgi:hypothetical protein